MVQESSGLAGATGDVAGARPIVNIVGERVALGPLSRALIPSYNRWTNDFAMQRTLGNVPEPLTLERSRANYERSSLSEQDVRFTIYERATWRPVGITLLGDIDRRSRTAVFVIFIGEPDARGKGYGTETAQLMLDYAFTALGLHSVMLTVDAFNLAGIRAYERAGFREFGRRRECHWMGGSLWDMVYMECLATEFTSPLLGRVFVPDQPRT